MPVNIREEQICARGDLRIEVIVLKVGRGIRCENGLHPNVVSGHMEQYVHAN